MSTAVAPAAAVTPTTLITVKVLYNDNTRRFKLPLKDLGPSVFPQKLRQLLGVPGDINVIFERYSDSAGCYVHLDNNNPAVYKQLHRAAKAKLKLRIKVIVVDDSSPMPTDTLEEQNPPRYSYLETVLSSPPAPEPLTSASFSKFSNLCDPAESRQPLQWSDPEVGATQLEPRNFVLGPDNLNVPVLSHRSAIGGPFKIDCNRCAEQIANDHYHCSICEGGDFDLCSGCVDAGASCLNETHWLIKRFVQDGVVTNSTTETVAPTKATVEESQKELAKHSTPSLYRNDVPSRNPASAPASASPAERICNACLKELDETQIVSCVNCDDYDLCITCLLGDAHGHHPAHTFALLHDRQFSLKSLVLSRCSPGRQYQHAAVCDGCEKRITGVRHKCLSCPDWDYCSDCHSNVSQTHAGHRFVPVYESIAEPPYHDATHYGIYCDGPLCKDSPFARYITGTRYKCSICDDLDFCAKCEALPHNSHNRTHPMVMFKTPVRNATVSTIHEDGNRESAVAMGDLSQRCMPSQVPTPPELGKPVDDVPVQIEEKNQEVSRPAEKTVEQAKPDDEANYQAFFVSDSVQDGTSMSPNTVFQQTWTLFNPGPLAWPVGSDVRFVGGDSMFNVDTNQALSLDAISAAMESNKLTEPLEPGQSAKFTVSLKAPSRVGTAISYWRLKLTNGMPFGHRLWCDIQVREEEEPQSKKAEADPEPSEQAPKQFTEDGLMIFPKLEKESPEASIHKEGSTAPTAPTVSNPSERDVLEDVESLTLDDDTDAGVLTDEDYDILDASDQEYLEAKSAA